MDRDEQKLLEKYKFELEGLQSFSMLVPMPQPEQQLRFICQAMVKNKSIKGFEQTQMCGKSFGATGKMWISADEDGKEICLANTEDEALFCPGCRKKSRERYDHIMATGLDRGIYLLRKIPILEALCEESPNEPPSGRPSENIKVEFMEDRVAEDRNFNNVRAPRPAVHIKTRDNVEPIKGGVFDDEDRNFNNDNYERVPRPAVRIKTRDNVKPIKGGVFGDVDYTPNNYQNRSNPPKPQHDVELMDEGGEKVDYTNHFHANHDPEYEVDGDDEDTI